MPVRPLGATTSGPPRGVPLVLILIIIIIIIIGVEVTKVTKVTKVTDGATAVAVGTALPVSALRIVGHVVALLTPTTQAIQYLKPPTQDLGSASTN